MYKKIFFLLLINFLSFSVFIYPMEEPESELSSSGINSLPPELIVYMFVNEIRDIINNSTDIFDAHTKLSESKFIKTIISVNKAFRLLLPEMKYKFVQLMNEKFPNPFLDKTLEEKNEFLQKLLVSLTKLDNINFEDEILAAQAILAGANVNLMVGRNPVTPLLIGAILNGYKKFTKFLIEHGANLNVTNKQGYTPLLMAVKEKYPDIVEMLLEYGADPNLNDKSGLTPLMLAVHHNDLDMVKALLKYKADTEAVSIDGDTALRIAKKLKLNAIKKVLNKAIRQNKSKKCLVA